MDELCKSIMDKYNTVDAGVLDALRLANPNGLFLERHKQNQAPPYMTFNRISEGYDFYMDGAIKDARVQFSIYATQPSDLMYIFRRFENAFEGASLSYGSDVAISCYFISETGPTQMPDQSWQSTVDMGIMRS